MYWKQSLISLAIFGLGCSPSFGAEMKTEEGKKELQKFQGTWVMVKGEQGGKKASDEHVKRGKITYKNDQMEILSPNQTEETIKVEILDIDPSKNPKEFHYIRKTGPYKGQKAVGIYEFEGNDQYKFAADPSGKIQLKEFATKEGTPHVWNTWRRVKS